MKEQEGAGRWLRQGRSGGTGGRGEVAGRVVAAQDGGGRWRGVGMEWQRVLAGCSR